LRIKEAALPEGAFERKTARPGGPCFAAIKGSAALMVDDADDGLAGASSDDEDPLLEEADDGLAGL